MSQPKTSKHDRWRFCGLTLPGWLKVVQKPNGAMLLDHLGQHHSAEVAAQAYEIIEDNDRH